MRILQYEGISRMSKYIRFLTWNRTTHSAPELNDGRVIEAWNGKQQKEVRLVSSLHAQHTPGTIVKAYTIKGMTQMQDDDYTAWLFDQLGKDYAFWGGCSRFVTRRDPQPYNPQTFRIEDYNPKAWFCSCKTFAGLMHVGINLLDRIPPWRVSPGHINFSPLLELDEIVTVKADLSDLSVTSKVRKYHEEKLQGLEACHA